MRAEGDDRLSVMIAVIDFLACYRGLAVFIRADPKIEIFSFTMMADEMAFLTDRTGDGVFVCRRSRIFEGFSPVHIFFDHGDDRIDVFLPAAVPLGDFGQGQFHNGRCIRMGQGRVYDGDEVLSGIRRNEFLAFLTEIRFDGVAFVLCHQQARNDAIPCCRRPDAADFFQFIPVRVIRGDEFPDIGHSGQEGPFGEALRRLRLFLQDFILPDGDFIAVLESWQDNVVFIFLVVHVVADCFESLFFGDRAAALESSPGSLYQEGYFFEGPRFIELQAISRGNQFIDSTFFIAQILRFDASRDDGMMGCDLAVIPCLRG